MDATNSRTMNPMIVDLHIHQQSGLYWARSGSDWGWLAPCADGLLGNPFSFFFSVVVGCPFSIFAFSCSISSTFFMTTAGSSGDNRVGQIHDGRHI